MVDEALIWPYYPLEKELANGFFHWQFRGKKSTTKVMKTIPLFTCKSLTKVI
jgi:hypothetical protein